MQNHMPNRIIPTDCVLITFVCLQHPLIQGHNTVQTFFLKPHSSLHIGVDPLHLPMPLHHYWDWETMVTREPFATCIIKTKISSRKQGRALELDLYSSHP